MRGERSETRWRSEGISKVLEDEERPQGGLVNGEGLLEEQE